MGVRVGLRVLPCVLPIVVLACAQELPDPETVCPGVMTLGVTSLEPCNGCDDRCNLFIDDPSPSGNVDVDPSSPDYNGDMVGYEDSPTDGIVLDGALIGVDADGDGLDDSVDLDGGTLANGDADGDGMPDSWEVYNSTNPEVSDVTLPDGELWVVLPYGGASVTSTIDPSDIPISVRSADIYFLIDSTGSMNVEISNLASGLVNTVVPNIMALIEDVRFGFGHFRDYLAASGRPYYHMIDIRTVDTLSDGSIDPSDPLITGLGSLSTGAGRISGTELTESGTEALWATITGDGIGCGVDARPTACTDGKWGYPCFRPDAQPIIVLITDHEFHRGVWTTPNAGAPCYDYASCDVNSCIPIDATLPDLTGVVAQLVTLGVKVVGVWTGYDDFITRYSETSWGVAAPNTAVDYEFADIWYTVNGSGSVDSSGVPFLYGAGYNGAAIGTDVVSGIDDLVSEMLLDAIATVVDPDLLDGVDATALVTDVNPIACDSCTLNFATNTAEDVYPGTGVTFEVTFNNAAVENLLPEPAFYDVLIQIISDKGALLGELTVHVMVPGTGGLIEDPTLGSYWNMFDSTACDLMETVHWQRLVIDMTTPAGTGISFMAETSSTEGGLDTTEDVPLTLSSPRASDYPSPALRYDIDLEAALEGHTPSQATNLDFLRVTSTLTAGTPGDTPVLHEMTLEHYCL